MFYEVLINYTKPDAHNGSWSVYNNFTTYSQVVSTFKKEINSVYDFVYVRKRFIDNYGVPVITRFKLVSKSSYTFAHFPKTSDFDNFCLVKKFNEVIAK